MISDRIKQFISYKNISVSAFERSIGMSNGSISKTLKNGGTIGADKIENILRVYPEINSRWLITGEGYMLNTKNDSDDSVQSPSPTPPQEELDDPDKIVAEKIKRLTDELSKEFAQNQQETIKKLIETNARQSETIADLLKQNRELMKQIGEQFKNIAHAAQNIPFQPRNYVTSNEGDDEYSKD